jgi:hypothetical protein
MYAELCDAEAMSESTFLTRLYSFGGSEQVNSSFQNFTSSTLVAEEKARALSAELLELVRPELAEKALARFAGLEVRTALNAQNLRFIERGL